MKRRSFLTLGGLGLVGGVYVASASPGVIPLVASASAQDAARDGAASGIAEMTLGQADAPVTLVEYASFTCPHCATFHAESFARLKADYIDTGKVRFIYREVYFDRPGLWASMVARCGSDLRFFGIADMLYARQRDWTDGGGAEIAANLRTIGKIAGLTDEALDACLNDAEKAQALVDWYEANAAEDGVESTPTFIIDGERYSNMAYAEMSEILDGRLES